MTQNRSLKKVTFSTLMILIIVVGVTSLAAMTWTYLSSCSYVFKMKSQTTDYDYIKYGGETTTGSNKYAYLYAEVQKLNANGNWVYFDSVQDTDYMVAGASVSSLQLDPGFSYRLKLIHKVYDMNMVELESFTQYSTNYITSMPRP